MSAPISRSVVDEPGAQRVHHHALDDDVRIPAAISAATIRKAADEGSAGTTTGFGASSGRPTRSIRRPSAFDAHAHLGAEMRQHFFGMIARGLRLDHGCRTARVEAGKQHRGLDLRRGDRRAIENGRRIADALEHDRTAPARRPRTGPLRPSGASGSRMRLIGRFLSEASPSKVAVTPWLPTTPIISREPVPALPKSSVLGWRDEARRRPGRGSASGPGRVARSQRPAPRRPRRCAGRRRPRAAPRLRSRRGQSRPKMKARWEIDLSPGGRKRPRKPPAALRALSGARLGADAAGERTRARSHSRRVCAAAAARRSYHSSAALSTARESALTGGIGPD